MTDAVTSPLPSPPTPAHSSASQDGVVIAKGLDLAHVSDHLVADPHSVDWVCFDFRSRDWL